MASAQRRNSGDGVTAILLRLVWAFLFRRAAWRESIETLVPLPALALLFISLLAERLHSVVIGAVDGVAAAFAIPALFFYLVVIVLALAEPALNLLLKASTIDEPSLHWWAANRHRGRAGIVLVLAFATFVYALVTVLGGGMLLAITFAVLLSVAQMTALLVYGWNYRVTSAAMFAVAPLLVLMAAITALLEWWAAVALFLLALALSPAALHDLAHRHRARRMARDMIAAGRLEPEAVPDILAEARLGGDQSAASMLLAALKDGPFRGQRRPSWLDVRVLSGAGLHVEAIDRGLMALDTEADAQLHLALAEASLAARDPDNAAAHAEEALEAAGDSALTPLGIEALLLLALASFCNEEIESGLRACERLLNTASSGDRRFSLIMAETRALVRRFGREMVTEEV